MTTYYTKSTDFTTKDSLASGNPLKVVKGSEFDTEFNNIVTGFNNVSTDVTNTNNNVTSLQNDYNNFKTSTNNTLATAVITGEMRMFAGSAAPGGWLICDGSAVSRSTYSALFNEIGSVFGAGDGSTTFNLPDMRGRVPLGAGQGTSLTNRALGSTGGEETHKLTTAEMPSHTHPFNYTGTGNFGSNGGLVGGGNTTNTAATGGDGAHNNMQPFATVNFIIKT